LRRFTSDLISMSRVKETDFSDPAFIRQGWIEQQSAPSSFWSALFNDLNTPAALGALFSEVEKNWEWLEDNQTRSEVIGREDLQRGARNWAAILFALGLDLTEPVASKTEIPADITALAEKRWAAKQSKDFAAADALRKDLTAAGWTMLDRKDGYSLEPAKK
jgi:cysteinyl-tRNA synthetase